MTNTATTIATTQATSVADIQKQHAAWLAKHYEDNPPIRLAEPTGYEGEATYVDTVFNIAEEMVYKPLVKRGRGRPRKNS